MRFLFITLAVFCILPTIFASHRGERIEFANDEYDPEAIYNRHQLAREYIETEQARANIREDVAKEEVRHIMRLREIKKNVAMYFGDR
ncbi:Nematode Specific Peptide family, group F [Caenorhabditis elegans]|uniref:Nematode Specific Peptide family, group F n=1 Tax=Caenorhabditis elegans TaxID=6239 RepID=Q4W509_CAEEL|nr:Nematode Specific Peptide family, group F [Caenorhabditis elegans]CCD69867.1 Nematode Specific Peptide family, group F [Caenorhabditis elegans]|eukprot:NP_001022144.1 Nematode Specific Peptide family, group F [Caenorhabditis elegans]